MEPHAELEDRGDGSIAGDAPGGRMSRPGDDFQQSRFPGSVLPDNSEGTSSAEREGNGGKSLELARQATSKQKLLPAVGRRIVELVGLGNFIGMNGDLGGFHRI